MIGTNLDRTHELRTRSWLASANDPKTDFPMQNLPFGVFRRHGTDEVHRGGVAIGDRVIDLAGIRRHLDGLAVEAAAVAAEPALNRFMAMPKEAHTALRFALFDALADERRREAVEPHCLPLAGVELKLPASIGDFTDFYASIQHAMNVGSLFRPEQPLLPNYRHVPIAYHGRSSSIFPSGVPVQRPRGQVRRPTGMPAFVASERLDYEAEIGFFVGVPNKAGTPIALESASEHIFGFCIVNDWSARDIQAWEYQPLGPFLGKNFATTISPWVVTRAALLPFRKAATARGSSDPEPLSYLRSDTDAVSGAYDIRLRVEIATARSLGSSEPSFTLSESTYADAYWTPGQMLAHHTSNGCPMRSGDLVGSGTLSGSTPTSLGSLLEISSNGASPRSLGNGEQRSFLEDGDELRMVAWCEREGFARIGFGECRATIVPAKAFAEGAL